MYLIIGGPSCLGAFPYEYQDFPFVFKKENVEDYLNEAEVEFYNQLFGTFLEQCFGLCLEDIQKDI